MADRNQEDRALRISVGYGVFAAVWVLFSDLAVSLFVRDPSLLSWLPTAKGLLFVAVTGMALYSLVVTYQRVVGESRGEAGAAKERLREVLESLPMLVVAFDTSGSFVAWNRECERVLGYSSEEVVGDTGALARLVPDARYRNGLLAEWEARGNAFRDWEWHMTAKDGHDRVVSWSSVSETQRVPGWSVWNVGVDVTDKVDPRPRIGLG